jgi:hypothetical protein
MLYVIRFMEKYWISLTLLLLAAIATLSLWPAANLPVVPGTDKTHHFIAYAALILPTALRKPRYYRLIIIAFLVFSGAIELIQPYVNRYGEWLDMGANALGLFFGFILAKLASSYSQKLFKT